MSRAHPRQRGSDLCSLHHPGSEVGVGDLGGVGPHSCASLQPWLQPSPGMSTDGDSTVLQIAQAGWKQAQLAASLWLVVLMYSVAFQVQNKRQIGSSFSHSLKSERKFNGSSRIKPVVTFRTPTPTLKPLDLWILSLNDHDSLGTWPVSRSHCDTLLTR